MEFSSFLLIISILLVIVAILDLQFKTQWYITLLLELFFFSVELYAMVLLGTQAMDYIKVLLVIQFEHLILKYLKLSERQSI